MAFVIAAVCFIFSLGGLSQHETARRGNLFGIIGMSIAVFAALLKSGLAITESQWEAETTRYIVTAIMLIGSLAAGAGVGIYLAVRVEMTDMPQLVAILHSFVGLAAVIVGFNSHFHLMSVFSKLAEVTDEVKFPTDA